MLTACCLHVRVHTLVYVDASNQMITDQLVLTHAIRSHRFMLLLSSNVMQLSGC